MIGGIIFFLIEYNCQKTDEVQNKKDNIKDSNTKEIKKNISVTLLFEEDINKIYINFSAFCSK